LIIHGVEPVASKSPSAMTEVGDGELDTDVVLVGSIAEEDEIAAEAVSEAGIVDELTTCVGVTIGTLDEGVGLAMELVESVDCVLLELRTS
jgi:hypothetical protein